MYQELMASAAITCVVVVIAVGDMRFPVIGSIQSKIRCCDNYYN